MKFKSSISEKRLKILRKSGKSRRFFGILLFFLCGFSIFAVSRNVEAGSASISIDTKNKKVEVGDTVYVIITVRSSQAIKGFEGYFAYDNRYLRFESGGSVVHGNDDAFRILDVERASSATKIKYSVKFTARKEGGASISLREPYNVLADDGNNSKMSVAYSELNMAIVKKGSQATQKPKSTEKPPSGEKNSPGKGKKKEAPKESPGKNTEEPGKTKDILGSSKLRTLEVEGTQLTPEFSADIEKYSGMISTSKEELPITYEAEDSNATVKISGNKNIKDGKNVIKVTVKSTSGRKTTYRLSITVQKISPEEDSENSQVTVIEKSGELYVVGTTTICVGEAEEEMIPDGFEKISLEVHGKNITCYALEGDREADYVLIYGEEEKAFYLYDREADSLQSYEKVKMWYQSSERQEISNSASLEQKVQSYQYVLAIMGTFCALMLLFMIYFALHSRKYRG